MSKHRKTRTTTTEYEQSVLAAHIQRFFDAPERSIDRADLVRAVLAALNFDNREWTPRLIRLWFNNNRKHYLARATRTSAALLTPLPQAAPPFHSLYVPLNVRLPPLPLFLPPAIVPRGTTTLPIDATQMQDPDCDLLELPSLRIPPKSEKF
jgi:hypothetical protein